MRGNVGVKVFALFWISFQLFFAQLYKSRFIRIITILVTEYRVYFIECSMHVVLEVLAMSMLLRTDCAA